MDIPHQRSRSPRRRAVHRFRKRWLILATPLAVGVVLLLAAPQGPGPQPKGTTLVAARSGLPFRYLAEADVHALDLDPRLVAFDLYEGWDREQEAYADRSALAFVSGPMYERSTAADGREITVPLGDLKLGGRIWRGLNRSAARQRAYVGIRYDGAIEFGYGELTPERQQRYDTFIGGLHSLYNDQSPAPADYRGAYSISMGQQIRYFLPRIRVIYGLRPDGRLEILMSRDGLTLEQTRDLARRRGLQAAYLPDHASKSRLIIPGVKGFSAEDANWISGGATSFVHVPYMLRLSPRSRPLQGSLLAALALRPQRSLGCGDPLACGRSLATGLLDRSLAGFNRLMERGIEPLARLIWAPRPLAPGRPGDSRAPFREPVITADPRVVQVRQARDLSSAAPDPSPAPGAGELAAPQLPPPQDASSPQAAEAAAEAGAGGSTAETPVREDDDESLRPAAAAVEDASPGRESAAAPTAAALQAPAAASPPPPPQPPPLTPPPPLP